MRQFLRSRRKACHPIRIASGTSSGLAQRRFRWAPQKNPRPAPLIDHFVVLVELAPVPYLRGGHYLAERSLTRSRRCRRSAQSGREQTGKAPGSCRPGRMAYCKLAEAPSQGQSERGLRRSTLLIAAPTKRILKNGSRTCSDCLSGQTRSFSRRCCPSSSHGSTGSLVDSLDTPVGPVRCALPCTKPQFVPSQGLCACLTRIHQASR